MNGLISKVKNALEKRDVRENIQYYALMLIPMVLIFIFSYIPLYGIVIAFQDYFPGSAFIGKDVEWVGLKWFEKFISSHYFTRIMRNTLVLNFMGLVLGFPVPIIFALIVNEIRSSKFRKFTQTVSYLPHFLSAVIVAGLVSRFIASDGVITLALQFLGFEAKSLNVNQQAFPWIYTLTNIWKSFGWSSIIYLSSLASIDPGMYEAAMIDGAGRMKRIWYITIPCLMPLIMIQLILSIGNMLASNTEMILLLYNESVYETADVIGTYMYRETLMGGEFSYGTASGLLMSIFSFILLYIANAVSRKYTEFSMW